MNITSQDKKAAEEFVHPILNDVYGYVHLMYMESLWPGKNEKEPDYDADDAEEIRKGDVSNMAATVTAYLNAASREMHEAIATERQRIFALCLGVVPEKDRREMTGNAVHWSAGWNDARTFLLAIAKKEGVEV